MEPEKEKTAQSTPASVPPKEKNNWRGNKKVRLVVILALLVLVAILFVIFEKLRLLLAGIFIVLLAALGLEVSNNDWDMEKLIETGSFEESKLERDDSGNILFDRFGNETTDSTVGKGADEYNCADFTTQGEAQTFFEKVGGVGNDVNRLDGNKDGEACESLPRGE